MNAMFRSLLVFALLPLAGWAHEAGLEGEAAALYDQAAVAESELRTRDALQLFLQVEKLAPDNAKVMQKLARQYSDSTIDATSEEQQLQLLDKALEYSQRAVDLDPQDPINVL